MAAVAALPWAGGEAEAGDSNFPENKGETKFVRVSLWLKKICGNCCIPFYEVNERTVNILYDLMERCEARERDISLVIEDLKHQETVHEAATKEMQDIFKDLRFSPTSLTRKASRHLSSLAKSAAILETKDTSLTSLFYAVNNITSELFEKRQKNKEMRQKLNITKKKLTSALTLEKQLLKDLEDVEQSQARECDKRNSRSQTLKYLKDKNLELRIRIRDAEKELIDSGLDRSLTHEALVQFSRELAPVQKKIVSLKKQLVTYLDLPLSIPLAEMKVEREKMELNALEDELSKQLDMVAFEMM